MKFITKLLISFLPIVVLALGIVTALVLNTGNAKILALHIQNTELELEFFLDQAQRAEQTLRTIGVAEVEFYRQNAQRQVINYAASRKITSGYLFVIGSDGEVLHPLEISAPEGQGFRRFEAAFEPWGWTLGVALSEAYLREFLAETLLGSLIALIFVLLPTLGVSLFLARNVSRPIEILRSSADQLAKGKLSARVEVATKDELGQLAGSFNAMADSLEGLTSHLEEEVRARTQDLERSMEELEMAQEQLIRRERIANMGGLVAGVAHEVNTPLGNSLTGVTYLIDALRGALTKVREGVIRRSELETAIETSLEAGAIIRQNLEKTEALISRFKQLAVDQSGEKRRRFSILEIVMRGVDMARALHPASRILIHVHAPKDLTIDSYPSDYEQIVVQLISNSLVHGFEPGEAGEIHISAEAEGKNLVLGFQDTGCGMVPETADRVFEPFFTTRPRGQHTGLGMNIVFNTVHGNLRGTLAMETSEGQGVRFTIVIPDQVLGPAESA